MATTTSITTTYAGEESQKYASAALLSGDTLSKGLIEIKPNIKYRETLKRLSTDDILKDGSCDFDPTSSITFSERVIEPLSYKVNLQLCKEDFRSDWEAESMGFSAHDQLPPRFADYLLSYVAAKVAAKTETNIWSGVASNDGEFDGFETLLTNQPLQPTDQEVAGTTVTAANVVAELGSIVDAIPNTLFKEDLCIYIPISMYRLYIRAQAALGFVDRFNNQDMGEVMFDGIPLKVATGMSDNKAVCTYKDNLYFGTGILSDHTEVKVLDMAEIDLSDNVRIAMKLTAAVQIANPEDVVTYGITNTGN
jgi:hypothetical protein